MTKNLKKVGCDVFKVKRLTGARYVIYALLVPWVTKCSLILAQNHSVNL